MISPQREKDGVSTELGVPGPGKWCLQKTLTAVFRTLYVVLRQLRRRAEVELWTSALLG